ncbi:vWA domain-containing protein [Pseudorhodoferax sp.]|uniref:vWA domain-containing protein n=1 Tax=Pseudorhodoferax sp. TaxID=1993553 RepID=UPI002DD687D2|nr:VWA domain-containing protein [Pseudorhodoferax sp.]
MVFQWPQMLWLLVALPLLVAAYAWLQRRRARWALRYPSLATVRQAARARRWRRHLPPGLLLLALAALLLAAARPLALAPGVSQQATVLLVMDVSLSMHATDIQPSRLAAAQNAARAFVQALPRHVQVGVVSFAETAQLVQRPTPRREDVLAAIARFQLQRGTAVGSGIVAALATLFPQAGIDLGELLYGTAQGLGNPPPGQSQVPAAPARPAFTPVPPGSTTSAALLLLTDGRSTTGVDALQAARMAAERGVRVYTVGLGTHNGGGARAQGWSEVLQLDEPTLQAIASMTQGRYFHADSTEALHQVYEQLGTRLQLQDQEIELAAPLALTALALLLTASTLAWCWRGPLA